MALQVLDATRELDLERRAWERHKGLLRPAQTLIDPNDPTDPKGVGWDGQEHLGLGAFSEQAETLVFASAGADTVRLPTDRLITGITLVADPYQHDVTTATITVVQDAVDKLLSGLNIVGGGTFFSLNNTPLYLKALSAMNKAVYGNTLAHDDLATAVANDNVSYQAWHIPFGALSDYDWYDITAGIPAELLTDLELRATFGANNIIATTAANGTVDTATTVYVVVHGVQGLPRQYLMGIPRPDFIHHHVASPTAQTDIELQVGRYLKRLTIVNLAVAASNNEARNDGNITDVSLIFTHPSRRPFMDRVRWRVAKHAWQVPTRQPGADKDGAVALDPGGLDGVLTIDFRKTRKSPFGLSLYPYRPGEVFLRFTMGTTTGSIHVFAEYYDLPDPSIADFSRWPSWIPA